MNFLDNILLNILKLFMSAPKWLSIIILLLPIALCIILNRKRKNLSIPIISLILCVIFLVRFLLFFMPTGSVEGTAGEGFGVLLYMFATIVFFIYFLITLSICLHTFSKSPKQIKANFTIKPTVETAKKILVSNDGIDREMLQFINSCRKENGLNDLQLSENLNIVATLRATELANNFSHTRPNGESWASILTELQVSFSSATESIFYGAQLDSVNKVAITFKNSKDYQNLISSSISYMGVGKYVEGENVYWIFIFTS